VCIGNLRQLGIGLQSYVGENSAYPKYMGPATPQGPWEGCWAGSIQSAIGDSKPIRNFVFAGVWRCPSAPKVIPRLSLGHTEPFVSYGYNGFGLALGGGTNSFGLDGAYNVTLEEYQRSECLADSVVVVPAEMMAIGDSLDGLFVFRRYYNSWVDKHKQSPRHQDNLNALFCDGHVESPAHTFVFKDTTDSALARWNRDHRPHRELLLR
jgi:prepilin-type processing-associated H-X9-DG protein